MEKTFFISADIEGITDVTFWSETEEGQEGYEAARAQMTREVAAACEAVLESGNLPVVRDGHGNARNISHLDLPEKTVLMRGWACHPGSMMAGLSAAYSGVLYIGYHAPAGSDGSPLAHTVDHEKVKWAKVNGRLMSEFTMNSLYAAALGVPSLFISGDETICRLAAEEVPLIAALPVKTCRGNSTRNLHPLEAARKIKESVAQQIAAFQQDPSAYAPPALPEQLTLEVCLSTHQGARSALRLPGVTQLDPYTVRYVASTPKELNIAFELILG